MSEASNIDWQQLYRCRQSVADQFGDIWSVPVAKRYHLVLENHGGAGTSMLEVGAGARGLKDKMASYWGNFSYRSCDIDPTYQHDFSDIESVEGSYDLVCAFELIEHLALADAGRMVERMYELLQPGGRVVLTTPNIFYPPAFMRDATHITPFCYDELGGLLKLAGFEILEVKRLYHDSLVKKFIRRVLLYPFFRGLGIDFAKQIIVVAQKPQ